jgi:hypothetical protein
MSDKLEGRNGVTEQSRGYRPIHEGYQPKTGAASPKPPSGGSAVGNQPVPLPGTASNSKK